MTTGSAKLSEETSEKQERLELVVNKLNRAKLELLSILKALPLSEEELDEEAKRAVEETRKELTKREV
jgi:hypothetical protein